MGLQSLFVCCVHNQVKDSFSEMNSRQALTELDFQKTLEKTTFQEVGIAAFDNLSEKDADHVFGKFDVDCDNNLNEQEFSIFREHWLKPLLEAKTALVIVDYQNDFITGSLALKNSPAGEDAETILPTLNTLITEQGDQFDLIVYTYDWHPANHISFVETANLRKRRDPSKNVELFKSVEFVEPPTTQIMWPTHCVQNTWGAKIHKDLIIHSKHAFVYKGTHPDVDSYSAFFDNDRSGKTDLDEILKRRQIGRLFVCGLATDVCVGATANDALALGYQVAVLNDCSRGVDSKNIDSTYRALSEKHAAVIASKQVEDIVHGKKLPVQWALLLAENCKKM